MSKPDIDIIPEMLGVLCVDDIDEEQLASLLHELVAAREKLEHVRVICQSLDEEAAENPLTKLLPAPNGIRIATKAIRLVLNGGTT